MAIFRRDPPNWTKIAIFDQYLALAWMNAGVSSVVNRPWSGRRLFIAQTVTTKGHASVNLVYDTNLYGYAKDNKTEFNCTH